MKTLIWQQLTANERKICLQRPLQTEQPSVDQTVQAIVADVKKQGDKALLAFTEQYDKVTLNKLQVTPNEFSQAQQQIKPEIVAAIKIAIDNITCFHQAQITT